MRDETFELKCNNRTGGHKSNFLFFVLILLLSVSACKKEDTGTEPPGQEADSGPTQYGEPFSGVPNTADIAMYEVNLRAFSASGDLKGVQERLDEIQDLGINVIWLMPIYPTGDEKSIGSPYAVSDYTEVNPDYGDLDDLRSLVEEAHSRDMAVILDLVANHTAWDHPWMENPNWYTRDASGNVVSPPGMGWNDVADLNYNSRAMREEMIEVMKYWVLEANVDGYRADYAEGVPLDFWKEAINTLRNIPDREIIMFAEAADKEMFSAGFDLIFGWTFYHRLKEVFNDNAPMAALVAANANDYSNIPDGSHILRWIDNHDDNAWEDTPVNIFNGQEGSLAAFVITAYMGGVPLIYNGQEVAFPRRLPFFEGNTVKIDWSINPDILAEYQRLMAFRNSSEAVKRGSIETYHTDDIMAFKRVSGTEEVLVIVNVRNKEIHYQLPSSIANTSWADAMSNETVSFDDAVSLEPFSYLILEQ